MQPRDGAASYLGSRPGGGRSKENQTFVHTHFQQKGKDYKVDDSDCKVDKS